MWTGRFLMSILICLFFLYSGHCICRFKYLYLQIQVFAIYHACIFIAYMYRNIMRNTGATPASALRMGELVPRGQRNDKDVS